MKLWDIKAPRDNWERNYARLEYQRIVWHDLWQPTTYVEVKDDKVFTCMRCGTHNTFWTHACERCDLLNSIEEDRAIQDE